MYKVKNSLEGRALPAALLTIFIDTLGVGILVPIFTLLILPGPQQVLPAGWSAKDGYIMLGWLSGIFSFCIFLAAPILGQLSDRYGRKKILAGSLLGTALGYILFAIGIMTKNIPLLFFSRAVDGLTGGNIAVARAVIGDVSTPKNRTKNFGLMGAMFGLGFVLGPYLGGRLASPGIPFFNFFGNEFLTTPSWFKASTPFWFAAILAVIDVILIFAILPETLDIKSNAKLKWTQAFSNIKKAFKIPGLRNVMPTVFLYNGGFTFFTTFFGLNLAKKLGFGPANIADFFSYIGISIVVVQAAITPFVAKRFKNYQVIRVALVGLSLAILGQFIPENTAELLAVSPFIALFVGLTMANMIALISSVVQPKIMGEAMGINSSVEALAQGIPAVIAGYVAGKELSNTILIASIIVMVGAFSFWVMVKPKMIHEPVFEA